MRSSPRARRSLALFCLIAAVVIAVMTWQRSQQPVPTTSAVRLPSPTQAAAVASNELADPPEDPVFGQHATTAWLHRQVEMYQHDPARPTAPAQWVDHLLNSEAAAPRDWPVASADFFAGVVQIKGRWLARTGIQQLGGLHRFKPQAEQIPQNMLASFSISGDYLVSSADPAHPQAGDLRISWSAQAWPPASAPDALVDDGHSLPAATEQLKPGHHWRDYAAYLLAAVLLCIAMVSLRTRRGSPRAR